jgi:hypothetical protein
MVGADPHPRMPITDNAAIVLTIIDIIGRTFFMGSCYIKMGRYQDAVKVLWPNNAPWRSFTESV